MKTKIEKTLTVEVGTLVVTAKVIDDKCERISIRDTGAEPDPCIKAFTLIPVADIPMVASALREIWEAVKPAPAREPVPQFNGPYR